MRAGRALRAETLQLAALAENDTTGLGSFAITWRTLGWLAMTQRGLVSLGTTQPLLGSLGTTQRVLYSELTVAQGLLGVAQTLA